MKHAHDYGPSRQQLVVAYASIGLSRVIITSSCAPFNSICRHGRGGAGQAVSKHEAMCGQYALVYEGANDAPMSRSSSTLGVHTAYSSYLEVELYRIAQLSAAREST